MRLIAAFVSLLMLVPQTVLVSGRILDREGKPLPDAIISYTSLQTGRGYQAKTDKNGEFSMAGVAAGYYQVKITDSSGKQLYSGKRNVLLATDREADKQVGADQNVLNVDLSVYASASPAPAAGEQLSPEQRSAREAAELIAKGDEFARNDKLEDALAQYKRAAAIAPNPGFALYRSCNAKSNYGDFAAAADFCRQAIAADPAQWDFYQSLASARVALGQTPEALESYEKGVARAQDALQKNPGVPRIRNGVAQMLTAEGSIHVKQKKFDQAAGEFTRAAEFSAYPAMAYSNLCAVLYNSNHMQDAVAACQKANDSDPNFADPYFTKASALLATGTVQNGNYVVPPDTRVALRKYLELAPNGQHVSEARALLEGLEPSARK